MKYNELGKTGVLVSELCLGTMTFGGKGMWQVMGQLARDEVAHLVKTAFDSGINFFDTANVYSEGQSEILLGESIKKLGIPRQEVVIATKVQARMGPGANQMGLSRLHMMNAVDDSLKRLQLSHIDLLYIHGVDPITPLDETMRGLEDLVRSGKVRYIGVSNHPAWMVMKANCHADKMGWTGFVASQNYYTIANREIEREIIPMAISENISIIPWSPLAGGFLSGKYTRKQQNAAGSRRDSFDFPPIDKEKAYDIIDVMSEIALHHVVSVASVALQWVVRQPGITSTIIGVKNMEQLKENISAVQIELTREEMQQLEAISALQAEYPQWVVASQMGKRWPKQN